MKCAVNKRFEKQFAEDAKRTKRQDIVREIHVNGNRSAKTPSRVINLQPAESASSKELKQLHTTTEGYLTPSREYWRDELPRLQARAATPARSLTI